MPEIRLETFIDADINLVFDLSRSVELHQLSTVESKERVVAGRLSGLMELDESVTWEACHFGVIQQLSSKITALRQPDYFVDEMQKGIFFSFKHEHIFKSQLSGTIMIDVFNYVAPLGILGRLADRLFLYAYMKNLLIKRNEVIRLHAEQK
ncbi:SRPBCC family protein [Pedobacter gandavensis]|uniref:SRPBCC family protein n=1 Tax=Pedobacter gandavensis TaxID=2679963 RepID=UPI00293004F3|nr:SRPBCC family protein [Pedobacter gandavensis]